MPPTSAIMMTGRVPRRPLMFGTRCFPEITASSSFVSCHDRGLVSSGRTDAGRRRSVAIRNTPSPGHDTTAEILLEIFPPQHGRHRRFSGNINHPGNPPHISALVVIGGVKPRTGIAAALGGAINAYRWTTILLASGRRVQKTATYLALARSPHGEHFAARPPKRWRNLANALTAILDDLRSSTSKAWRAFLGPFLQQARFGTTDCRDSGRRWPNAG